MLRRLGRFTVRRRKTVLVASALFFAAAGVFGGPVAESLTSGGFDDPSSESSRAGEAVEERFGVDDPDVLLLVTAPPGETVDDPDVAAAGTALTDELAAEADVTDVASYWSLGNVPPLRSDAGRQAMVLGAIQGDDDAVDERIEELSPEYTRARGTVTVAVGGNAFVFRQVGTQIENDLTKAELIALPITLILLVLVFGSVVAAGAGVLGAQLLDPLVHRVVVALDRAQHHRLAAGVAAERRNVPQAPVGGHVGDVGLGRELVGKGCPGGGDVGIVDGLTRRRGDEEQHVRVVDAE